jgi:hypothetical protein
MRLGWILLANYAEAPPGSGLVNLTGAGWDTINVIGPIQVQGLPPTATPPVTALQGSLAFNLLFHVTEAGRSHDFAVTIMDADGNQAARAEGSVQPQKQADHPLGWDVGVNAVLSLTGILLPKFGLYRISVLVDGAHLGDLPFRVVKRY